MQFKKKNEDLFFNNNSKLLSKNDGLNKKIDINSECETDTIKLKLKELIEFNYLLKNKEVMLENICEKMKSLDIKMIRRNNCLNEKVLTYELEYNRYIYQSNEDSHM